jgi:peptidoglycan/LPS O-acetylase OafA/YrhL
VKTRDHYAALDGLRGFAALSVVLFHFGHWLHVPLLAANSHLAVDFFFCLSGFVLPLAYEKRLSTNDLSLGDFLIIRLIRLMPIILLATLVSSLYVLFRSRVNGSPLPYDELLVATLFGLINVPFLTASSAIGGPQVFPLNGPQYSLFLEVVVNIFWSVTRGVFQPWLYLIVFFGCLAGLAMVGFGGDEAATFWFGFLRVGASFFAGVLVYHFDQKYLRKVDLRAAFWFAAVLMAVIFYYPYPLPLIACLGWIAIVSPLVVLTGSRVRLSGRSRSMALLGGALSYPVYALHYPIFCWLNGFYQLVTKQPQNLVGEGPLLLPGILVGSYVALKLFDEPVRSALSRATRASGRLRVKNVTSDRTAG